jgi:hypothetical protein
VTRRDRVKALLLSMDSYVQGPKGWWDGKMVLKADRAGRYVRCSECAGCGRLRGTGHCQICLERFQAGNPMKRPRHGCRLCLVCDGRGERRKRKSDPDFDSYTGMTLSDLQAKEATDAPSGDTGAVLRSQEGAGGEEVWVKRQRRLYESGSYRELLSLLTSLRQVDLLSFALVMTWVREHDNDRFVWGPEKMRQVDAIVDVITECMPAKIRVPNSLVVEWRREQKQAA